MKDAPWHPTSIAGKLRLAIGLGFALIAFILSSWLWSLYQVNQARKTIATCTAIERTVLDMDRLLEKARRLHGDFCVQYSRIGLTEAHVQFAQPSIRLVAEAVTASSALGKMLDQTAVSKDQPQYRVDLNLYLASAKRFGDTSLQSIDLITRLAAPERGLEATLNRLLSQLSNILSPIPSLADQSRDLQLTLQRYLSLRQRPIMQTAFNMLAQLQEQLARRTTTLPATVDLHDMLAKIKATGEEMVQVDTEIKNKLNDFNLQNNISQPIARMLVAHAAQEVQAAKEVIAQAIRNTVISLIGCLTFALGGGVLVSRLIAQTITRRIETLNHCAAHFQQGQLDIKAPEHPADELGQLGQTFNLMSNRIAATLEHLEQTIAERTGQLSASEHRFRSITDQLPHVAIIGINRAREVFFWNRACRQLYGLRDQDAHGQRLEELIVDREQRSSVRQQLILWIEQDCPLTGEMIFRHQQGRQVPVFVASLSLRDPTTGHQEFYSIQVDLSELKASEEQRIAIEAQLQRSRKMEAIGLLAGGVAHDLNNILSGIVSYPDLLLMQLPADSKLRKPVLAIQESGQRAAAVVADLLTVARGVSSEKTACALNQLINQYLLSPEHEALLVRHPGVRCHTALAASLPSFLCSPIHIKKSLMNLITNAAEAIDHGGQIFIRTRAEQIKASAAQSLGIEPGHYVVVEVADSGSGISEADLEHIFEPFYTKKAMGRSGTGLGLAVVWNTIEDHRGGVQVASSEAGTVFTLYFPASHQADLPAHNRPDTGLVHGAGQRVLVVDDELLQREIAAQFLDILGYRPLTVASGEAAVELLKTQQVDLVLLDMLMGSGINGRQTYERILHDHPGQKALIVSGYAENDEVHEALALGVAAYLQKPYTLEHLSRTVATILASSPEGTPVAGL